MWSTKNGPFSLCFPMVSAFFFWAPGWPKPGPGHLAMWAGAHSTATSWAQLPGSWGWIHLPVKRRQEMPRIQGVHMFFVNENGPCISIYRRFTHENVDCILVCIWIIYGSMWSKDIESTSGWWLSHPPEKYISQFGWWNSQLNGKIQWQFQPTNQINVHKPWWPWWPCWMFVDAWFDSFDLWYADLHCVQYGCGCERTWVDVCSCLHVDRNLKVLKTKPFLGKFHQNVAWSCLAWLGESSLQQNCHVQLPPAQVAYKFMFNWSA